MKAVGCTSQQMVLLAFIQAEIEAGRPAPSFTQMAEHMGLASKSGIHRMVEALVERGHLTRMRCRARAIALAKPQEPVALPEKLSSEVAVYARRVGMSRASIVSMAVADYLRRNL